MTWSKVVSSLVGMVALIMLVSITAVEATTLAPDANNPDLVLEGAGLTLAAGGVGLDSLGAGTETISVNIGGPVEKAILYWSGRHRDCSLDGAGLTCDIATVQPYRDQELIFDGTPITGDIIGTELQPATSGGPQINVGYSFDVTSQVSGAFAGPGNYLFDVQDGDIANDFVTFDGAGLLVIYTDPADSANYRVILFEGADFAFCSACGIGDDRDDSTDGNLGADPVVFKYDTAGSDLTAQLALFVGDAEASRPDLIRISDNGDLENQLDSSAGDQFDIELLNNINIPAGATETTVQLFSQRTPGLGTQPDSMLWVLGALRIPVAPPANPAIDIEKATNGQDADLPTGPVLPVGSTATFTYEVKNTGDVPVSNVVVVDDNGTPGDFGDDFNPAPDLIGGFNSGDINMDNVLDLTEVWQYSANRTVTPGQYTNGSQVCGDAPDGQVVCDDDPSNHFGDVPQTGGEGCTPGYWKQAQHFDSWVGFVPTDDFETTFGVDASFDKDLLGALKQGGGGEKALGRHAVAALLNTANGSVAYAFDTAGVIALVQEAYNTGDFEGIKNQLASENELGCPLN